MKSKTLKNSLLVAVAALVALPLAGRAQVVFSDSFESDGDQQNLSNYGYTFTTNNVSTRTNGSSGSYAIAINQNDYSFGYSTTAGHQFALFHFDGTPNGNDSNIQLDVAKDTGVTTAFGTTYTLTYLVAPTSLPVTFSLLVNGVAVASETDAATGTNTFSAGTPVTFDDLPYVTGSHLGVEVSVNGTVDYDRYVAFDNLVITATPDAVVPEPSTYALIFAGFLALVGLKVRAARS